MSIWKKTVLAAAALVIGSGGIFALLAWQGCLFPVHYAKPSYQNTFEEGYHVRVDWNTWSNEGKWTLYWRKGGRKCHEGYYHNNCKIGAWTLWNTDGSIRETEEYADGGVCLSHTDYENGVPKLIEKYDRKKDGQLLGTFTTENGVTRYKKYVMPSSTSWIPGDPKKNAEVEDAYQEELRRGATKEQAREAVRRMFNEGQPFVPGTKARPRSSKLENRSDGGQNPTK
jgi:hypothetical protein